MSVIDAAPARKEWTAIGKVKPRAIETTGGRIAYIEVSPRDAPARLTVRVVDPSGAIDCIFLGRRMIAGLEPGDQSGSDPAGTGSAGTGSAACCWNWVR